MQSEPRVQSLVSTEDAVWRAVCLGSLMFRAHLENELKGESRPAEELRQIVAGLNRWATREGVEARWSKKEKAALEAAPGQWDENVVVEITWRAEALGMLGWALSLVEAPPPWDVGFDVTPIVWSLRILEDLAPLRASARLRPAEEIARQREVAELWHWRARSDQLQRRAGLPPSASALQAALEKAIHDGAFTEALSGDFPACGKPYRDLNPMEAARLATIAHERHYAMNWLCGYSQDWDKMPTDT